MNTNLKHRQRWTQNQLSKEANRVALHNDSLWLIKEYARQGYALTQNNTPREFERLWSDAFPALVSGPGLSTAR